MSEEYLTISEISVRLKIRKQTLYNLIYQNKLTKGIHYFKPLPKKILFSWIAMIKWVESSGTDKGDNPQHLTPNPAISNIETDNLFINI
jgi:hypothetical protein